MSKKLANLVPFDEIEGVASENVPAYSNNQSSIFNIGQNYVYGVYTGFRWQCVEYARRWLILRKGCTFKNVGNACDMWKEINEIERLTDGKKFLLRCIENGSERPPKIGSLLIYPRSFRMPFGHVAVITGVVDGFVHISEQNHLFQSWETDFARRAALNCRDGRFFIDDTDPLFGWLEIDDEQNELKPFQAEDKERVIAKFLDRPSTGFIGKLLGWNKRKDLM